MSYTWDGNKNKTSESISGVMSGYGFPSAGTTYDHEDRLTGFARASGSFTQSWNLTSVGDWNSVTTNGTAQNRTHGPTHELLTAGGQNVSSDVKGNITYLPLPLGEGRGEGGTGPHPVSLLWDFDNKLKSADTDNNGTADVNFHYDALGRRVARVGRSGSLVYVQLDQQTIADYGYGDNPSSPTYRYVYVSYIDEPVIRKGAGTGGTIHYYHRNQHYSITAATTSTGSVAERYAYTAYGQPTILDSSGSLLTPQGSTLSNRYTYTGREWEATLGLFHFRARWMSGLTGRFLQRDPIGFEGSEWNLYEFLNGGPLLAVDWSGLLTATVKSGKEVDRKGFGACSPGLGDLQQDFDFMLEYRISGRLKCSAMMIRKVTVTCAKANCPCGQQIPDPKKDTFSYFEMSEVGRDGNDTRNRRADDDRVTHFGISRGICSSYHQTAVTKIFCKTSIAKKEGGVKKDWEGRQLFPIGSTSWCRTEGGPHARENLDWFDGAASEDGAEHTRTQTLDFCCCGKDTDFFKSTSDAKP